MPSPRSGLLAILAFSLAPFSSMAQAADTAAGNLLGSDGTARGTIHVTEALKGVLLRVEAKGLTPGWHGIHFHEKGDCGAPKFTSAGAHVHATSPVVHGLLNPNANDAGDLPIFLSGVMVRPRWNSIPHWFP